MDWELGDVSASLSNSYLSGYDDQNTMPDGYADQYVPFNRVSAYSIWDMSGAWRANKALTVRAGVKNLLDTPPPFSNQSYFYLSGYDPTYTDPRGRFFYVSAQYKFK